MDNKASTTKSVFLGKNLIDKLNEKVMKLYSNKLNGDDKMSDK